MIRIVYFTRMVTKPFQRIKSFFFKLYKNLCKAKLGFSNFRRIECNFSKYFNCWLKKLLFLAQKSNFIWTLMISNPWKPSNYTTTLSCWLFSGSGLRKFPFGVLLPSLNRPIPRLTISNFPLFFYCFFLGDKISKSNRDLGCRVQPFVGDLVPAISNVFHLMVHGLLAFPNANEAGSTFVLASRTYCQAYSCEGKGWNCPFTLRTVYGNDRVGSTSSNKPSFFSSLEFNGSCRPRTHTCVGIFEGCLRSHTLLIIRGPRVIFQYIHCCRFGS